MTANTNKGVLAESHRWDRKALRVTEIFYSLQGESRTVGLPTVFIRLTGCPLRCQYCDTAYAFNGGEWMSIATILEKTDVYNTELITVTGGEPLAQSLCLSLLAALCDRGYQVSLETSGAMDLSKVDSRVVTVMDLKTPGSGEQIRNNLENLNYLKQQDQVKFVICNEKDYQWASEQLVNYGLAETCEVLFSPSYGQQNATQLADWILRDNLPVRYQLQLHKILWGDEPGR
ncbi:MAG: 7-carboxy-7-deazaguanine synthase QueE [Gammaproteobacteria bacterium]|nr:7-carboxy-7-deazaguanine synthase QueE [Gammaproteobacteria bacterium]